MPEFSKGSAIDDKVPTSGTQFKTTTMENDSNRLDPNSLSVNPLQAGLLIQTADANSSKVNSSEKPYSLRLPWGPVKEKQNSIYNKHLILNLKNVNNFDASLTSSTASSVTDVNRSAEFESTR